MSGHHESSATCADPSIAVIVTMVVFPIVMVVAIVVIVGAAVRFAVAALTHAPVETFIVTMGDAAGNLLAR